VIIAIISNQLSPHYSKYLPWFIVPADPYACFVTWV